MPRLVARRENAVFEARLARGARVALRFHRPGYMDPAAIETELGWTETLAGAGIACPRPLRTDSGRLVARHSGHLVSAVSWIDARPISEASGDTADLSRRLGICLAEFHTAADRLALCPVPRHTWKAQDLIGAAPRWGGFWHNPALTAAERAMLCEARGLAQADLSSVAEPDVGLIHADTLRENILDDGKRLWLIDFDDSGWGYRGYDLGTALIQQLSFPGHADRAAALAEGYLSRRPHDAGPVAQLPLFVLIRGLVTAGWIVSRAPPDDPRQRLYAERALAAARMYLAG